MTTLTQNLNSLLIDREGAEIAADREATYESQNEISRSAQPFSELKSRKFRRLFNRHSIIVR